VCGLCNPATRVRIPPSAQIFLGEFAMENDVDDDDEFDEDEDEDEDEDDEG
jgi:hypothetical protein